MQNKEMFAGLKVIELASVLAGPGVGQFFAELGADVIKVENKSCGGDVTRTWKTSGEESDDRSAYFCSVNWGKKSIALDLHIAEDRTIALALLRESDIIISSYKPGDAEKLGVDYATIAALNPAVIYGQVSGYGPSNQRVGYDAIIQAEAGFMFMNGSVGGPSLKMPVAMIDILAGHQLKEGILVAMLQRTRTGVGSHVEVSLIQAAIASLVNQATNWLQAGYLPEKHGSSHPNIAPYGDVFRSADDQEILLAVGNDRQFKDLCELLDDAGQSENVLFKSNALRVKNRAALNDFLQSRIGKFTAALFMQRAYAMKIPAGEIRNLQQVFETDEAKQLLLQADGFRAVKSYVVNVDEQIQLSPPPHLGEHTDEIIRALNIKK